MRVWDDSPMGNMKSNRAEFLVYALIAAFMAWFVLSLYEGLL